MAASPDNASLTVAPAAGAIDRSQIEVRPVASLAEYHACADLQVEVWGDAFDTVPASMLQVATYVGGLCIGAFTPDGELCGFVFGLAGEIDGRRTHWSHLLGVKESVRNLGVGRLLKEYQRQVLASRGIPEMCWTFDPLIAKNAHLNLNVLGASVLRYVPDMYGTTDSPLHHGLATDRLVVSCPTMAPEPRTEATAFAAAPVMTPVPQPGDELFQRDGKPAALRIEVPSDFPQLLRQSPATAVAWHGSLRSHFQWALDAGYAVAGLQRDPLTARTFYALQARN
jgi:chorismate synthase